MPMAQHPIAARALSSGRCARYALALLVLLAGCRPEGDGVPAPGAVAPPGAADGAAQRDFDRAPDGKAELRRIQTAILNTGMADEPSLAALRALYAAWPAEPEVVDAFETALSRRNDFAGLIVFYRELPALTPLRQSRLGLALLEQGRFQEAADVLLPLSDGNKYELDYLVLAARAELRTGDHAAAARRLDPALSAIRSFKLVDGLVLRGQVALAEGNPGRARALFEEVLAIDDTLVSRDAYDGLGQALQLLGEVQAAEAVFARLDALERANAEFAAERHQAQGQVRALDDAWHGGDIAAAAALLDTLLEGSAQTLSLYERRVIDEYAATVYRQVGRAAEADAAATRVAEHAP